MGNDFIQIHVRALPTMRLMRKSSIGGLAWCGAACAIAALELLAGGALAQTGEATPLQNAGFEITDRGMTCQSIPGWTLYGAPKSSIAVVDDEGAPALRISRGKAFCYGVPVDPAADYVLTVRVRANKAKPRIEADPPLPRGQTTPGSETNFDWKTVSFQLPASRRPAGVRECWIALGAEATATDGAAWFKSVRLEPVGGGPNAVPNPSFAEPVVDTAVPPGWSIDSGGAALTCDSEQSIEGSRSLKVTGVGRPVRISQSFDLADFTAQGVRRVKISGRGKSSGLGSDRVRLEVYGTVPPAGPILSLSGDAEWMKGEAILDVDRQQGRKLAVWINAPRPFAGDAWFDDIRVEAVPDSEVVNLLSNASFLPSIANPKLPDFWGLWGDAGWCIEPWTFDFFGIVDEPGPFPPARVLRVHHPPQGGFVPNPPNQRLAMYVLTGSKLDLPEGDYTFSIYAKADRPNTAVHIHHPASERPLATARVGTKWQRIAATGTGFPLLPAIHIPDPGSVVWLSAPQLEPGKKATAFRPSPGEGTIAPPSEPRDAAARRRGEIRGMAAENASHVVPPLTVYAEYDHVLDDPDVRVRLEWSGPTPTTIHCRLLDALTGAKLPVQQQSIEIKEPGIHTVVMPMAGLQPGTIGIHAIADSAGKRTGRATDTFAKLARSGRDIRVNRFTRSLTVDGNPMLPIFLPIEPATLGDWHLDRITKAGFNCLVAAPGRLSQQEILNGSVPSGKAAEIRRQLDRLHARGMGLFWPIPWTFSDWANTGALYGGNIARLAGAYCGLVSAFRDHPAILGWYLQDEPSSLTWEREFKFTESDLQALWLAVKETDPGRPAYVNWNHSWQIEPYGGFKCTDVIGHDNYEISGEPFDYGDLLPGVQMVNNARVGRRPAFAWISGSYDEVLMRPSAGAVRVHAWLHLLHGTRGLGYWSKIPLDPQVWADMKTFNRDAAALHKHVLSNPDTVLRMRGPPSATVHHAVWTLGDFAYLLAVNTADCPQTLRIDVADACGCSVESGRRLYDDREIELEGGVLSDECAPLSRCLYRFALAPAAP